jgi:amino acid permease
VGLFASLGSIVFALACNQSSVYAYNAMAEKTMTNWVKQSGISVIVGTAMLVSMGLAGYLSLRSDVDGEILNSFTTHAADFFKFLLVVHLILYIPGIIN